MSNSKQSNTILLAAWVIVMITSQLPKVIMQEIFGHSVSPELQFVISLTVALAGLLATLIWKTLRGLRLLLGFLIALVVIEYLVFNYLDRLPFYQQWLADSSFNVYMLAEQSLRLIVTLLIISVLLLMGKKLRDFYLTKGNTSAPVEPVRWLGVKQGEHWNKFGLILCFFISLGTLAFLFIAGQPSLDSLIRALPFMPVVLLAAALNALNEEMTYKASLLSVLEGPVGSQQALLMVAFYFGIGHFYGIPYGVVGVLLAAFLGWILAKSMLETRGLFWAWFIHFLQDVWIFSFLAIGSIAPGG